MKKLLFGLIVLLFQLGLFVIPSLMATPASASPFDHYFVRNLPVPIDENGDSIWPVTPAEPDCYGDICTGEDPIGPCSAQQAFSCEDACLERSIARGCRAHNSGCSTQSAVDGAQHCYCEMTDCWAINGGGTPAPNKKEVVAWTDGIIDCHDGNACP